MCERAAEEESRPNDQENKGASGMHGAGPSCVSEESHGIEPHQEADDGDSGVPNEFGYYV